VLEQIGELENLHRVVSEYFPITGVVDDGGRPAFTVLVPPDGKPRFLALRRRLEPTGLLPVLRQRDGRQVLGLIPQPPRVRWRWQVNLLLFIATLATTFLAGYVEAEPLVRSGLLSDAVSGGLAFAVPLMLILVVHEMGHKVVSVIRGVDASLPYFIPMIPPVGTMGAIIVTREPAPNRDALLDLGASGPIAGFLVAVVVIIVGLHKSFVLDPSAIPGPLLPSLTNFPDPLLAQWLSRLIVHLRGDQFLLMHPIYFAGWIGLLVTSINLLPASMLDGGHVVRAVFGARWHRLVSWVAVAVAVALRYYLMAALLVFIMLGPRRGHPGPLDDVSPVSRYRLLVGLVLLGIFIVSVVPIDITPIKFSR